jgi:hypothetical protein
MAGAVASVGARFVQQPVAAAVAHDTSDNIISLRMAEPSATFA